MKDSTQILSMLQQRDGSANWNTWQIHRWAFWDYVRLTAAGTNQITFFQNALGASDPVSALRKTYEQTNMQKSGTFGQVYYFLKQIRTHVQLLPKARQATAIATDADLLSTTIVSLASPLLQLFRRGVLSFYIGQKLYFEIERPLLAAPPGFGMEVDAIGVSNTTTATPNIWAQQSRFERDCWGIDPVQMIEPEQTFNVQIDYPDGNTPSFAGLVNSADVALNIGVILEGYIVRPAQ